MEYIIQLLSQYKYFILFPLAVVEGPIIAIIAGLLCTRGYLQPLPCYCVIVAGDVCGDSITYLAGRLGTPRLVKKLAIIAGINKEKLDRAKKLFDNNRVKAVSLSKIILGIGIAGIYMAGKIKIPYRQFFGVCLATSAIQYIFYLEAGLLSGSAYRQINHYMNAFAAFTIIAANAVLFFFFIKSIFKKI